MIIIALIALSTALSAQLEVESGGEELIGDYLHFDGTGSYSHIYTDASQTKGFKFYNSTGKVYLYSSSSPSFVSSSTSTTQRHLCVMNPGGYYKFWVLGDGSVYSVNSYITSDSTKKENVVPITDAIEKVKSINGVTYNLKSDDLETSLREENEPVDSEGEKTTLERNAGVFSQDVKRVLPEAVRTLEDGSEVVSYNDLVALLIEAVKEQQEQIEELQAIISNEETNQTKSAQSSTSIDEDVLLKSDPKLYQNAPNPFTESTVIKYEIPDHFSYAMINIYNLQGRQIRSYRITESGVGSISIPGSDLSPGQYIYNLVSDGIEVDSKKMILTN